MNDKIETFTHIAAEFLLEAVRYNRTAEQTEYAVRSLYDDTTSEVILCFIDAAVAA